MITKTIDIHAMSISVQELIDLLTPDTEWVLTNAGAPVARVTAIAQTAPARIPGLHAGMMTMYEELLAELA